MSSAPRPRDPHDTRRSRTRSILVLLAVAALLAVTITAVLATPASGRPRAATAPGQAVALELALLVELTNAERARRGVPPLRVLPRLTAAAEAQAHRMAARRALSHSPRLQGTVQPATAWGENVGFAGDARTMHRLWMASPSHRANILAPAFNAVGAATTRQGGEVWGAVVFAHTG